MSKEKEIYRIKELMFGKKDEVESEDIDDVDGEMTEEGEAAASTGGGGGASSGYPTVTKWESGVARGKANQIANNKWESGVTRGKANTLI
jgi:hypothetical protein